MTVLRGITLLDLIPDLPAGAQGVIPGDIGRFLEFLSIVEHAPVSTDRWFTHGGVLQGATDVGLQLPANLPLHLPGLNAGVPFQLSWPRLEAEGTGPGDMEGAPDRWILDIYVGHVAVPIPGPKPATRVPTGPAQPQHLVRDPSRDSVQITGSGVLRITHDDNGTELDLIAPADPLDPEGPLGTVLELGLNPPHMLFHDSGFGMSIGRVVWDATGSYTPPEIEARGHDASWKGMSLAEASLYLPQNLPLFGDVSFGVKDVLYGFTDPGGVQFEAYLELGNPLSSGEAIQFFQELEDGTIHHPSDPGAGLTRTVTLHSSTGERARVRAVLDTGADGIWTYPGARNRTSQGTDWFTVTPGNERHTLRFQRIGTNDAGETVSGPEITFVFRKEAPEPQHAPQIRVTQDGSTWDNVAHLSGSTEALAGLAFAVVPDPLLTPERSERLRWDLEHDGVSLSMRGDAFTPATSFRPGRHVLVLHDDENRTRRLKIQALEQGRLMVGSESGPRQVDGGTEQVVGVTGVEASHHLATYHESGARMPAAGNQATVSGGALTVPEGVLAEVVLDVGDSEDPDAPNPAHKKPPLQAVRIFMVFEQDQFAGEWRQVSPVRTDAGWDPFGPLEPYPDHGPAGTAPRDPPDIARADARSHFDSASTKLLDWANGFSADTDFVVIGRCDDLGPRQLNVTLGANRAQAVFKLLTSPDPGSGLTPIDASRVYHRGEQESASLPSGTPDIPPGRPSLTDRTAIEWRIHEDYPDSPGWSRTPRDRPARLEARCVDVYAVRPATDTSLVPPSDDEAQDPARRRVLVPGPDRTTPEEPAPRDVDLGYRLQLRAKWDSPTVVDKRDWIPVLVEMTLDWQRESRALPDGMGNVQPQPVSDDANAEIWRFLGRFAYDPRSGQTEFTAALDTPGDDKGIFHIVSPDTDSGADEVVALALGLGPALLAGVDAAEPGSSAVRIGALLAAVAGVLATDIVKDGKATVQKLEIRHRQRDIDDTEGSVSRVVIDYTVELNVETEALGITTRKPAKFRYKGVGIEYTNDPEKEWYENLDIIYEDASFEIVDPGTWEIDGPLGELLGVSAVRLGSGSVWVETDLDFALDLGVVEISSATVRITVEPSDSVTVDLRGLAAKVDVPGAIKGGGQLQISDGGDLAAMIDLTIIPAEIQAVAALKLEGPMTQLEAGVRFATALPLAGTGFGLYGFKGRFVSNGTRDLTGLAEDPVERELGWFAKPVKYESRAGQYAIGLGAIVGTMPDTGFTFNATGMVTVEFPDTSVVFSIEAKFLNTPSLTPKEDNAGSGGSEISFELIGIVAFDSAGLAIAVTGKLEIEKVLKVNIPIGAYFPFQSTGNAAYLRIGSDGAGGRSGSPVTMTVLPDILDLKTWSFFMIEEKQLLDLGGRDDLDFHGFSIGYGAGWEFKWGGGPIYVSVSAGILIGMGTRPLTIVGSICVSGELWLVIVGISISGELTLRIVSQDGDTDWSLTGKFCGKVSFFFFSVEGCVEFKLPGSTADDPPAPDPDPLVTGITLTDKFVRVIAQATDVSEGAPLSADSVAWPDVAPTIHFSHRVMPNLPSGGFQPAPAGGFPGENWSGTSKLKFRFRLDAVVLELADETAVDVSGWPSAWWQPAFRASVPETGDTPSSDHEGWDLALLHWDPSPWRRPLTRGGEGIEADPAEAVRNLCEPAPEPSRHCVLGQDGVRQDVDRIEFASAGGGTLPYPSYFFVDGREGFVSLDLEAAVALADLVGMGFVPGSLRPLPASLSVPGVPAGLTEAFYFPYLTQAGAIAASLGMTGTFRPSVLDPDLVLAMCVDVPELDRTVERCVNFDRLQPHQSLGASITHENVEFTDRGQHLRTTDSLPVGSPDGRTELRFTSKGLEIDLPEVCDRVRVTVAYQEAGPIRVAAFDADGQVAGLETGPTTPNSSANITLEAPEITRILVTGGFNTGMLQEVCYRFRQTVDRDAMARRIVAHLTEPLTRTRRVQHPLLPQVYGERKEAIDTPTRDAWEAEVLDVAVGDGRACVYLRYTAPDPELRYRSFTVLPFPQLQLSLVSVCGISSDAHDAHDADEDAREDSQNAWNDAAEGEEEDRVAILDPGTDYAVRIDYSYAIWQGREGRDLPPEIDAADFDSVEDDWPDGVTFGSTSQRFGFRTAPEAPIPEADLMTFDAQGAFEPRGLVRYLRGFDPVSDRFTHFLDDLLLVHFDVEWVRTLLERYGYEMRLTVKRTDPKPPDPGTGPLTDLSVPSAWTWEPLPVWMRNEGDIRVAIAAHESDCTEPPVSGGTAAVSAALEPRAEYDLELTAVPVDSEDDGPGVHISRTHFRTSRYRTAPELLEALGLRDPGAPYAPPPTEALVSASAKPGPGEPDDQALDECLAAMGLDPFPLPDKPRTVLLWIDDGGWKLAGVLLDADESLFRAPRLEETVSAEDLGSEPHPRLEVVRAEVGGSTLEILHRNEAGTRVLLAPTTPLPLSHTQGTLPLVVRFRDRGAWLVGARTLTTLPHIVIKESV